MAGKTRAGRNKDKCQAYRANGTREKNKARKAAKHARTVLKNAKKRALKNRISEMVRRGIEEPIG